MKGDRSQSDIFGLDGAAFLSFNGLMQPIGEAPTSHHPAGKLIDQNHFTIPHDIIFIAGEKLMRPQALVDVVHNRSAFRIIERLTFRQNALATQNLFQPFVAFVGEGHIFGLFV